MEDDIFTLASTNSLVIQFTSGFLIFTKSTSTFTQFRLGDIEFPFHVLPFQDFPVFPLEKKVPRDFPFRRTHLQSILILYRTRLYYFFFFFYEACVLRAIEIQLDSQSLQSSLVLSLQNFSIKLFIFGLITVRKCHTSGIQTRPSTFIQTFDLSAPSGIFDKRNLNLGVQDTFTGDNTFIYIITRGISLFLVTFNQV